jgi:hypothetical protein
MIKNCKKCGCEFLSDLIYCEICRLYLLNIKRLKNQAVESLQNYFDSCHTENGVKDNNDTINLIGHKGLSP